MKDWVNISLAHTNADYVTAMKAFAAGANHVVHLHNAMPPFFHRLPGVIGAVFDSKHVMAEIICDGIHIHPSVVRATFQMMGADRMILISDSMRATGMPDGQYTFGGQDVKVACATVNPARSLGVEDRYGSIAVGRKADIVLLDENLALKAVIKDGTIL